MEKLHDMQANSVSKLNSIRLNDYLHFADSPHWCSTDAAVWGNDPPWEGSPGSLAA